MPEGAGLAWSRLRDADDEPVDVPRYLAALRRTWPLIALIIVLMTGTVLLLSLAFSKTYEATARILMDDRAGAFEPADEATVTRRLATIQALLTTRNVLSRATESLPDESVETLEDKVEASVDADANIVDVVATDGDPEGAAANANAVARSFLTMQEAAGRERFARARTELEAALDRLRGSPDRAQEAQAIRERLSELSVSEASAGTELQLAQTARPPSEPDAPRPVRNTIFAFFASAFIAVLAALAVDQLAPRLSGPRELSRLTGRPILAALPPRRRRRIRRGQTEEAYQALHASLLQLPAEYKVVLVTSAFASEDKSTVAARLGETLARSGSATLVMSADLRQPRVEHLLGVPRVPGLTDVVRTLDGAEPAAVEELLEQTVASPAAAVPELDVLSSGSAVANPAQVLAGGSMSLLFAELERSAYRYVVVDGSPLLGVIDGPLLARSADAVLVVCRLDRLTPAGAAELGDVLGRLEAPAIGLVAVGVRGVMPYSLGFSPRALEDYRSSLEV
jgi:succinoglycan biosynthesis transport protein ExoP